MQMCCCQLAGTQACKNCGNNKFEQMKANGELFYIEDREIKIEDNKNWWKTQETTYTKPL